MATTILGPDGLQHIEPALPVHAVKTYQVATPRRLVTCAVYGCQNYTDGWRTIVPEGPQADLARSLRGRYHLIERATGDGLVEFTFPAGQECWQSHWLPWDGKERFIERGGDWRGNPRGDRRELAADDWVDSFATHQLRLADRLEAG